MKKEIKINVLLVFSIVAIVALIVGYPEVSDFGSLALILVPAMIMAAVVMIIWPFSSDSGISTRLPHSLFTFSMYILFAYLCFLIGSNVKLDPDYAVKIAVIAVIVEVIIIYRKIVLYKRVSNFNNGVYYPAAYIACTIPFIGIIVGGLLVLCTCNTEIDL